MPLDYDELFVQIDRPPAQPVWPTAITRGPGPPDDPDWPTPTTAQEAADLLQRLSGKLAAEALLTALFLSYPFSGGKPPEGSFPLVGWMIKEADTITPDRCDRYARMLLVHLEDTIMRRMLDVGLEVAFNSWHPSRADALRVEARVQRFLRSWWSAVRRRFAFRDVAATTTEGSSLQGGGKAEKRRWRKEVHNGQRIEPSAASRQEESAIEVPPLPERAPSAGPRFGRRTPRRRRTSVRGFR